MSLKDDALDFCEDGYNLDDFLYIIKPNKKDSCNHSETIYELFKALEKAEVIEVDVTVYGYGGVITLEL